MRNLIMLIALLVGGTLAQAAPKSSASKSSAAKTAATAQAMTPRADADSVSVYILQRMSDNIKGLKSFSLQVGTLYDTNTQNLGLVKYSDRAHVRVLRPDMMTVERHGDQGRQFIVYDGKQLQLYNRERSTYAAVELAGLTVVQMVDSVSRHFGIDFPAADLLYPDFVEDALASATKISYLGITQIDGRECFHIAARAERMDWQLWIGDDVEMLPLRLVIVYTGVEGAPQYQADFTHWNLNEPENEAFFRFTPVPGATRVVLKSSQTE